MTISALPTRVIYQGSAAGNYGPFPLAATGGAAIPVMDATEVFVIKWPAAGGSVTLSQSASPPDYLVQLTPITIGGVTYRSAQIVPTLPLLTGDTLAVERRTALQQLFDPQYGGPNQYSNYEAAWDRLTKVGQELGDRVGRAIYADNIWDGTTLTGVARMNARGLRLGNLQAAVNPDEAVVLAQLGSGGSAAQVAAGLAVTVQTVTPIAAQPLAINLAQGYYILLKLGATIPSMSFSNWAPASQATKITIESRQQGAYSIPWPAGIKWAGGAVPTPTSGAGAIDLFVLSSSDGGATVLGSTPPQNYH